MEKYDGRKKKDDFHCLYLMYSFDTSPGLHSDRASHQTDTSNFIDHHSIVRTSVVYVELYSAGATSGQAHVSKCVWTRRWNSVGNKDEIHGVSIEVPLIFFPKVIPQTKSTLRPLVVVEFIALLGHE